MPLFRMSSKQSLRLFFPLYNALLITQIIRSAYIMTAASGEEDQDKWPSLQSYYYLRKIVTNSRKYDHVKCRTFAQAQLATCQTALISERLSYDRKVFKQPGSYLFMWQILQTFNHPYLGKRDTLKILLKFKTATGQQTFVYRAGNIWNNLDDN